MMATLVIYAGLQLLLSLFVRSEYLINSSNLISICNNQCRRYSTLSPLSIGYVHDLDECSSSTVFFKCIQSVNSRYKSSSMLWKPLISREKSEMRDSDCLYRIVLKTSENFHSFILYNFNVQSECKNSGIRSLGGSTFDFFVHNSYTVQSCDVQDRLNGNYSVFCNVYFPISAILASVSIQVTALLMYEHFDAYNPMLQLSSGYTSLRRVIADSVNYFPSPNSLQHESSHVNVDAKPMKFSVFSVYS